MHLAHSTNERYGSIVTTGSSPVSVRMCTPAVC